MWQQRMLVLTIYGLMPQANAGIDSRFNGGTSDLLTTEQHNNEQQQLQVNLNAWQPLTGHNNWLILQATAATSVQQSQHEQQQRYPVNYYAYNHRYKPSVSSPSPSSSSSSDNAAARIVSPGGNYKQVKANLNDSPSYVLAISQAMRRGDGLQLGVGVDMGVDMGVDVGVDEPMSRQLMPPGSKDTQEVNMRAKQEVRVADEPPALSSAPVGSQRSSMSAVDISNYLAPFEEAVLKVRNFCDTLRTLISTDNRMDEDDEDADEYDLEEEMRFSDTNPSKLDSRAQVTNLATSKEVQGRSSRLASSEQGRKLKKLKRKIQKLLLPLLIAYKLKFLTLIPVLIGGLTLLVGTTGLAGFFFALFTAVMSLKSSSGSGYGSKAIVLKKI